MQAVLLAAGTGTRLLPRTADRPKCMVEVNGTPIVDSVLAALETIGVLDVIVVSGYRDSTLREYLESKSGFRWQFIHNERYATTNNILSLQVAADLIEEDFLLLESDIYMDVNLLGPLCKPDRMLLAPYLADMDGSGVALSEEGIAQELVIKAHLHAKNRLSQLYKTVNLYSFSLETWSVYREALDKWVAEGRLDSYYEAVLGELIAEQKVQLHGVDVGCDGWAEVDDEADLHRLEASLQTP